MVWTSTKETGMDIGPPEWIIIGLVLLLVFGSSKIPQLARNLGRAQSELKKGLAEGRAENADSATALVDQEPRTADDPPRQ